MTFQAIRKFPGEDLDGLAQRIHQLYGEQEAAAILTYDDGHYMLQSRIRELNCVREESGRYYFNPNASAYSQDPILNAMIKNILRIEEKQAKERLRNDCER
jgi:hypothetical protein